MFNKRTSILAFLALACLAFMAFFARAAAPNSAIDFPTPTNGMRLVFYTDSYGTEMKLPPYLESIFWLGNPGLTNFQMVTEARGGDQYSPATNTAGLAMARLMGRAASWQPTHIMVEMTPNGGTDSNTWAGYWREYDTNITSVLNATGIYIGAPVLDANTGNTKTRDRSFLHYALGASLGRPASDLWSFMIVPYSNNYAAGHPIDLKWVDTTHPGAPGYLNIAYAIGRMFNIFGNGIVWSVGINASGNSEMFATNGASSSRSMSASGGTFAWTPTKGAMAWDDAATNALQMFPEILTYNAQMLYVSNLTSGSYTLEFDGTYITTLTHTQLAAGTNITAFRLGPFYQQGTNVLAKIRLKEGYFAAPNGSGNYIASTVSNGGSGNAGWYKFQVQADGFYPTDSAAQLITDMAPYRAEMDTFCATIRTAAAMTAHTFTITAIAGDPPSTNRASIFGGGGGTPSSPALIQGGGSFQ